MFIRTLRTIQKFESFKRNDRRESAELVGFPEDENRYNCGVGGSYKRAAHVCRAPFVNLASS